MYNYVLFVRCNVKQSFITCMCISIRVCHCVYIRPVWHIMYDIVCMDFSFLLLCHCVKGSTYKPLCLCHHVHANVAYQSISANMLLPVRWCIYAITLWHSRRAVSRTECLLRWRQQSSIYTPYRKQCDQVKQIQKHHIKSNLKSPQNHYQNIPTSDNYLLFKSTCAIIIYQHFVSQYR